MESFTESTLSAYFHGLVDVCLNDDGQPVYVILKDGDLQIAQEYTTETESFIVPEKKHFPFALPRASEVIRYYKQDDARLYSDLLAYLKRFSALDDNQWNIVAHYVFLTYLHDHQSIDYCPYILFNAVPERGKSRTGKSIIYAAFRGIHLIELREATIFRYSQNLHGTLFFDLLDISKKAERGGCDDILTLRAEKGAKCNRVQYPDQGPFNDTVYYDIYGPTIISSNEQPHPILETRCLPINMPNRPGNYENPRPEFALELKERLTAWRAKHLYRELDDAEEIEGISGRLWDLSKPLFAINRILHADHQELEDAIQSIAGEKDASRKDTVEGQLVAIIKEITDREGFEQLREWTIKTNEIRTSFNKGRPEERHVTPQWIGKRLKRMSFKNRIVRGYSEIVITSDEYAQILRQYGYSPRESSKPVNSQPEINKENQGLLRKEGRGRESAQGEPRPDFTSSGERECYEENLEKLTRQKGLPLDETVKRANADLEQWRKDDEVPF